MIKGRGEHLVPFLVNPILNDHEFSGEARTLTLEYREDLPRELFVQGAEHVFFPNRLQGNRQGKFSNKEPHEKLRDYAC